MKYHPANFSAKLAQIPARKLSLNVWRQTAPVLSALDLPARANAQGRYHRKGQAPPLYTSTTEQGAWAELAKRLVPPPPTIKRRITTLKVTNLSVLDLTDSKALTELEITEQQLTSDDYVICQAITEITYVQSHFGGILAPSATHPDANTLAIFPTHIKTHVYFVSDNLLTLQTVEL